MTDLATLDIVAAADQGAEMTLLHPVTRQPVAGPDGQPVTLRLAGQDSETWRRAQRAVANKRLTSRRGKLTAEELEAEALDTLARCTLGWRGVVLDGRALDCTFDNARRLYERLPWVREQVDEFVTDRANYLGN